MAPSTTTTLGHVDKGVGNCILPLWHGKGELLVVKAQEYVLVKP